MSTNLVFDICQQRRKRQLFNNASNRVEMLDNPYGKTYTMEEINMRRKAEILQYAPNRQSGQTNSMTKTQKYSLLVNAPARLNNWNVVESNADACPNENTILIPTSSSDVPGPIQYLKYDKPVTLYNYINPLSTRSSPSDNTSSTKPTFEYIFSANTFITDGSTPSNILSIYYNYLDTNPNIIYITIPYGIYVYGIIKPLISDKTITVTISDIILELYLDSDRVQYPLQVIQYTVNFSINNTLETGIEFKLLQYIGNINISYHTSNLSQNKVYDIKINYTASITDSTGSDLSYFSNINYGLISNMDINTETAHNCNNITQPSPKPTYTPTSVIIIEV